MHYATAIEGAYPTVPILSPALIANLGQRGEDFSAKARGKQGMKSTWKTTVPDGRVEAA